MNKFILLFLTCLMLSGCGSLIPNLKFGNPITTPESTVKSKTKHKCSGKIDYYEDGTVKSCSRGYYAYDEGYNRQERKYTFTERIKNMINSLAGWGFWGLVLLLVLCPSLIGMVLGRLIEATVGITGQALKSTVRAIGKAKKNGGNFMSELDKEHSKNRNIQKKINALRAEE